MAVSISTLLHTLSMNVCGMENGEEWRGGNVWLLEGSAAPRCDLPLDGVGGPKLGRRVQKSGDGRLFPHTQLDSLRTRDFFELLPI